MIMSVTRTTNETTVETSTETTHAATVSLRQPQEQEQRGVKWTEDTVDNEHLDRKSSKCCCIYKKPRALGESSTSESDSDDDTNPYERTKKKKKKHDHSHSHNGKVSDPTPQSSNKPS